MLQLYLQIDDTVYDLYLSHKHPKSPLYKLVMPNLNFCIYTHPFKKSLFVADKCQDEKHLLQLYNFLLFRTNQYKLSLLNSR